MDYCIILKLHETLTGLKLTLPKLVALLYIEANPETPISGLKYPIGNTVAALTCMTDYLEKDGFIKKQHGSTDRRHVLMKLTGKGTEVLEKYRKLILK